jgi:sugar O-acyltransferase (sialic acid O-acetyltransferase NeuD family)
LIDDLSPGGSVLGHKVIEYTQALEQYRGSEILVAIGDTRVRRRIYEKVRRDGFSPAVLRAGGSWIAETASIGKGSQLFFGAIVSENAIVGENVILNFHCCVSHDSVINAHCTLAPRVAIAGRVVVEREVTIGIGATVINGSSKQALVIGEGAFVGAGACIIRDVEPGSVMVGVPGKPLPRTRCTTD